MKAKVVVLILLVMILIGLSYEAYAAEQFRTVMHEGEGKEQFVANELLKEKSTTYTVKEGDNLFRIAVNHGVSLESLRDWNNLVDDSIFPGDVLEVREDGAYQLMEQGVATSENDDSLTIGKEMIMTATAYTAYCKGCSGTTAYGIDLRANPNEKVIAVDPKVIPLGTKVWVEGYGEAIAGDTGGAIKGDKIDVFIPTYEQAMQWGRKQVMLKIVN